MQQVIKNSWGAILGVSLLAGVGVTDARAEDAPAADTQLTSNVSIVSDYRFRGISQTFGQPAIQGGFDAALTEGYYLGTWGSSVYSTASNGIGTSYTNGAGMEWDFYGGRKFDMAPDTVLDVGVQYYYYPAAQWNDGARTPFNNLEAYVALSYKWISAKYSYALSDYFGANSASLGNVCGIASNGVTPTSNCFGAAPGSSQGSGYLDLNANIDLGDKMVLTAHAGHLNVQNYGLLDYSDYRLTLAKEVNGYNFAISAVTTDARSDIYRTTSGPAAAPTAVYDASGSGFVISVSRTF